jgi:hypothetical protein
MDDSKETEEIPPFADDDYMIDVSENRDQLSFEARVRHRK